MIIMESQIVNLTKRKEITGGASPPEAPEQTTAADEKIKEYIYDMQSRAFFLTINNPIEKGLSHDEIIDIIHKKFKNVIYWCMCDEKGSTYHTHVYILLAKKKRWSAVVNAFKKHAHLEESVKGSPQQCRAYLRKEGQKHKKKAETNFPETFYEEGEIPSFFVSNDRVEMLEQIEEMIESGMRPEEIFEKSLVFRQFENIIRKQFFAKRFAKTPPIRDVSIIWHLGASGSGKSFSYVKLCEEHEPDNVFYASDFANNCSALLDNYEAQEYLFIDEVKPDSFKYGYLLQLLQGYRTPIHARYSNVYSLWKQIDITSIFTPQDIYEGMVDVHNRSKDSLYQLTRRITKYVYHWKTDDGQYHSYEIPATEFVSYEDLVRRATGSDGFTPLDADSDMPFNQ